MKSRQIFMIWIITLMTLFTGACATDSPAGGHADHAAHSMEAAPVSVQPDRTIRVETNDQMRFVPESLTVRAGETIRFEINNTGLLPHEFIIGTAHIQAEHAQAMESSSQHSDMHHDDTAGYALSIPPGETGTLTYTFDQPGELFYGCHVPGHYAAGMQGAITVTAVN